jgi:hypothetical protein
MASLKLPAENKTFNYFKTKKCCERAAVLIEKVKELESNIDKDLERIETLKFQNIE